MKKNFYHILFFTGLITCTLTSLNAQPWIGDTWGYRRLVTIANPGSTELTDYQVNIKLDNTFNFADAKSDGSDIRITAADGITLLPFWIEEWNVAGTTATIWIKVPSIPTPAGTAIYLYYGNPAPVIPPPDPVETPPIGPYTKDLSNPIIPINVPVGRTSLLAENIVYDEDTQHYWMVLTDQTSGATVCLVYSDDPTNPAAWYWGGVVIPQAIAPHIMKYNGTWYIFYGDRAHGGPPYPIAVATSPNVNGPYTYLGAVLQAGASGTWEGYRVDEPCVFKRSSDGKWILIYMGDVSGKVEQVGYAEADNITGPYTKFGNNPCIPFGPSGSYDAGTVADPWVYEYYGVYYIGYTVSSTTSSPWQTAVVSTTDWQTFTKLGVIVPRGDEFNTFRGAVTLIGNEYVFSYTGGPASGQYRMGIATQPVFMAPDIINNGNAVFDFFDGFDGANIDLTKWVFGSGNATQTFVGGGLLTMTAATSPNYVRIFGNKFFGMDYMGETRAYHPNQGIQDLIAEVGFADGNWNDVRIVDDFHLGTTYWQRQAKLAGDPDDFVNMAQTADQNWHIFHTYRQSPGTAGFQIDNNPIETVTTNVPTINLPQFLMSYGNANQFVVDWTRVRKYNAPEPSAVVGEEETNPLPVELSSFSASIIGSSVKLSWRTETEVNNYGFEVERQVSSAQSSVGNYEKIGFINGNGNSNSPKNYSFTDLNPITGSKFYYRLKQIDNDGQFEYSNAVEIQLVPTEYALYQNYPNPFNPSTMIRYQLPNESKVVIKIYNILGSEVMELVNEQKEAGVYEVEFDTDNLSSGTYIYRIIAGSFIGTKTMLLLK